MGNKTITLAYPENAEGIGRVVRFSAAKYLADIQVRKAVEQMFSGLPFPHRFVLLMAYHEKLNRADISFVMGISEPTVEKLLQGAKKQMLWSLKAYTKDTQLLHQFPKMISKSVLGQYYREDAKKISEADVARILQHVEF